VAGQGEQDRRSGARPSREARQSRRRFDEVFGDVLPETTADEREPGGGRGRDDDWYLDNRPPHHDR
jgi:hypothetical protein